MNTEENKIAVVNFYETDLIQTRKKKRRVIQTLVSVKQSYKK